MLTEAQVRAFAEQGAVTIDTPLSAGEIAAASEALDRLLPFRPAAEGEKPRYRVRLTCTYHEPALVDVIQHPFFEETAKSALRARRQTMRRSNAWADRWPQRCDSQPLVYAAIHSSG